MVHLLGENWKRPAMEQALRDLDLPEAFLPIHDQALEVEGSPWKALPAELRRLATDRAALREFAERAEIPGPRWKLAATFEEVSRQVIAWGRFPLALKSVVNGSEGAGVFRLEGYRELAGFYDKVRAQTPDAPVLIEDWIDAAATVEVTVDPRGGCLFAQKGLEKSLSARTSWAVFPVRLPDGFGMDVERILTAFSPLLTANRVLVRFTIAFAGRVGHLISLSGGFNRLEYFPGWGGRQGKPPILQSLLPHAPAVPSEGQAGLARLQVLRRPAKDPPFPEALPPGARNIPVTRFFPAGRKALALLEGQDPRDLQERSVLLARLLEEAGGG